MNYYLMNSLRMKSTLTILISTLFSISAFGQEPFNCVEEAYLFQYNDVYAINLASGNAVPVATDISEGNLNAVAYNPSDGYIWGYISTPANSVARVGKNFNVDIYTIPGYRSAYVGAIDAEGIFYSKAGGTSYDVVDLNPNSATYLSVLNQATLSQNISIADWAINAADGMLYTVTIGTNQLCRIDPSTSEVTELGEVPILSGVNYTYGAVYFDVDGNFYVSANQTGTVYMIKAVQNITPSSTMVSNLFAYGPASAANDGARCPTAPVPQEICDNGIDDDGDGLVDCDDPSCSGVEGCPDLTSVSGGNSGGLESNNRLSQAIAKRNYRRAKNSNRERVAEHLPSYDASTASSTKNGFLKLNDLVPIGILNESHAVESTPKDLIDITNASDVFAVDYFSGENSLASVLALKTEGKVYEHSKFICDRLLGAEVHSVANIYLREQPFIRTIIYRADGSREFVLSFSVRLDDGGSRVESHWNLDKYTEGEDYYNFQIWTSSIDDLISLSEGILDLVDLRAPILGYDNSEPPHVFVKRAAYNQGKLLLEVMNNNFSKELLIEGGVRRTETSITESLTEKVYLEPYINNLELEIGNIFDLGFRITADVGTTPDDLFISDGPWGYDDSAQGTEVLSYEVIPTGVEKTDYNYVVERGIEMSASVHDYVSAYRALTPRFEPVDLSSYSSLKFNASGAGIMEISLIKESISSWEKQLHASVELTESNESYSISKASFKTISGETASWEDIKLLTFTWRSADGKQEIKEVQVGELEFVTDMVSSINELGRSDSELEISPNPFSQETKITFQANQSTSATIYLINAIGNKVQEETMLLNKGENIYNLYAKDLDNGHYYLTISLKSGERLIKELVKLD